MSAHTGDYAGAAAGIISSIGLGKMLGLITIASISQAFVLGVVGAVAGYLAKKGMDLIFKTIKQKLNKKP